MNASVIADEFSSARVVMPKGPAVSSRREGSSTRAPAARPSATTLQPSGDTEDKPLDETFRGWDRALAAFEPGLWWFGTIRPGRVPGRHGHKMMAPRLNLWIVARGLSIGLHTRMCFADEAAANAEDPVLRLIEHEGRRKTLIAQRATRAGQGCIVSTSISKATAKTVFFDA
jgi:protocatechuate 3,4-dioxygenase, alpha subunit